MNKLQGKVEIKQAGEVITVIASDETFDRHGDVLPLEAWDLSKFIGSPRMLVDHDHRVEKIVGKWINPRIESGKLLMDAVFHGITELSKAVQEMVLKQFLDTVSVGFIPYDASESFPKGRNELIETSWVTVPANPSARVLKELGEKGATFDEKMKIATFFGFDEETIRKELGERKAEDDTKEKELKSISSLDINDTTLELKSGEEIVFTGTLTKEAIEALENKYKPKPKKELNEKQPKALINSSGNKERLMRQALKGVARAVSRALQETKVE